MIDLRDYQHRAVDHTREALKSAGSVVLVLPTGAGKTRISAAISERVVSNGKRILFVAPRRSLVAQTHESFERLGLDAGVYMAGVEYDPRHKVDIASIDTLLSRLDREHSSGVEMLRGADVIFIDEAHCYASTARAKLINDVRSGVYGPKKKIILLTATPCTTGGRGLGKIAEKLVIPVTMTELIDQGFLLRPVYYSAPKPDLSQVTDVGDDYNSKQLGDAYSDTKIMGSVVDNWIRIAPGTSTVVFAPTRANANSLVQQFHAAGVSAAYLDAHTPDEERQSVFASVASGKIKVICNVLIVGMGVDIPRVQTISFATSTKSIARWCQGVGRALRPFDGQKAAIIIDHGGMSLDPGMGQVELIDNWSLDGRTTVQERTERKRKEKKERKSVECPECHVVSKAAHVCPNCGHVRKQKTEELEYHEAELQEITGRKRKEKAPATAEEKQSFYSEILGVKNERGYSDGWVAHTYRNKFGVWPRGLEDSPKEPSEATRNYVRYLKIRFAKSKTRKEAHYAA